jgi:hypothetical protein
MATKLEKQQSMFSMIEAWKSSGQDQREFCKSRGQAYSVFHYWYKKYRREQEPTPVSSAFVPVQIHSEGFGSPIAEVIFPDGKRLSFYRAVDASFLRALLL